MKETTDTASVVSYLDLHLEIDNESRLRTKFSIYMGSNLRLVIMKVDNLNNNCLGVMVLVLDICFLSVYIIMSFDFPFVRLFGVR